MTTTNFISGTLIESTWLNDVDAAVYQANSGITGSTARTALDKFSDVYHVKDFGVTGDGTTDDAAALQAAITALPASGGTLVFHAGTFKVSAVTNLKANITLVGLGPDVTIIQSTTNAFSIFSDNNVALSNVTISGMTIRGPSAPAGTDTNRGIHFDASGGSYTTNLKLINLKFKYLFRGIEIDQVDNFYYNNILAENLVGGVLYISEVYTSRSSRIRGDNLYATSCMTYNFVSGDGVAVFGYCDDVQINAHKFTSCGPSSGQINLYHALYFRSCRRVNATNIYVSGQLRGAPLHVYSDNGAGEINSADITVELVCDNALGAANTSYVGVRVDRCDGFVLTGASRISGCALQGGYFSNSSRVSLLPGCTFLNNNYDAVTSSEGSAAVLCDAVTDFTADGVIAIDDTSTASAYGQGTGFAFKNACPRYVIRNCKHIFPSDGTGYYFISHESGSTVTYPTIQNNLQSGAQSFLNEAGTAVPAGQGIILGHTRISGTASTPLTVEQLHRWRVREIWNEGARFIYESDGTNVWFWGSDNPGASTWVAGDRWIRAAPAAAGVTGGRCTAGGTPGTWKYESSLAA